MEQSLVDDIIVRLLDAKESRSVKQVQLSEAEIRQLCLTSKDIFISQPNLLELKAPINICGNIHGCLTDLRAAAVNNENFARVAVKNKLHLHLRHGSTALEAEICDFVKDIEVELDKPVVNLFGLGDFKAPKVLGDIVESIAGAIFLDNVIDTTKVWQVLQPLLHPMVTLETLPMHPVRELQKRYQQ